MNNTTLLTTIQFRIEHLNLRLDSIEAKKEASDRLLHNKLVEITNLLRKIIGTPQPSIESIIRLRETGTSTPPIYTREQSTQSPISSKGSPRNAENVFDCPILARQLNGAESPSRGVIDANGPTNQQKGVSKST